MIGPIVLYLLLSLSDQTQAVWAGNANVFSTDSFKWVAHSAEWHSLPTSHPKCVKWNKNIWTESTQQQHVL